MSPITSSITFTPQFANLSQTINRVAPILDGQMKLVCGSYETMTNHSGFVGYLVDGRTSYYLNQLEGLEVSDCLVPTGQSDFALIAVRTFAGQPYLLDQLQQATVMQNDQAMVVMLPLDSNFFITPTTLPVAESVISVATNRLYDWSLGSFVWQQCYTTESMSCDFTIYDTSDLAPGYSLTITAQSSATMQVSNVLNIDGNGLALMFVTLGSEGESASLNLESGAGGQQRKTIQLLSMQTMLVLVDTTSYQPSPMIQFVRRPGWRALLCYAMLCYALLCSALLCSLIALYRRTSILLWLRYSTSGSSLSLHSSASIGEWLVASGSPRNRSSLNSISSSSVPPISTYCSSRLSSRHRSMA